MRAIQADPDEFVTAVECLNAYPCFHGLLYAVDVMVPILDVAQEAYWLPDAATPGQVSAGWAIDGATTRWLALLLNAIGWILTTVFVVSVAGWAARD